MLMTTPIINRTYCLRPDVECKAPVITWCLNCKYRYDNKYGYTYEVAMKIFQEQEILKKKLVIICKEN
jgi:hypothetical protein